MAAIGGNSLPGFYFNDLPVLGFQAKCNKCGSENVSIDFRFNYYRGFTGFDYCLDINCRNCKESKVLAE